MEGLIMWPEIVGILIATVPIAPTFGTLGKIFFNNFTILLILICQVRMGGRCRKIHWPNQRCNVHTQHQCMPKRHFKMAIPQCRLGMAREWKHLYSMCLIEIKGAIYQIDIFCTNRSDFLQSFFTCLTLILTYRLSNPMPLIIPLFHS